MRTTPAGLAAYDANRRLLYRELTQLGYECIPHAGALSSVRP
ncbi:MAG: hypothetical protein ACLU38_01760 [Dysosmobacter sp.]